MPIWPTSAALIASNTVNTKHIAASAICSTSRLHARQAEGRASAGQGGADGCSSRPCGLRECPSSGRSARGCSSRRAVLHTAKSLPRRHCRLRPAPAAARRACGNSYTAGSICLAWAAPHGRQQPPPVHPITDHSVRPTQQAAAAAPGGWESSSAAAAGCERARGGRRHRIYSWGRLSMGGCDLAGHSPPPGRGEARRLPA